VGELLLVAIVANILDMTLVAKVVGETGEAEEDDVAITAARYSDTDVVIRLFLVEILEW